MNFDDADLELLTSRGLSILHLGVDDWENILDTRRGERGFSLIFPHHIARAGRKQSLVLIVVDSPLCSLRLGWIRSVQSVSTFDSRIAFDHVRPIKPGDLEALLAPLAATSLNSAATTLARSRDQLVRVSPKLSVRLIRDLASIPDNATAIQLVLGQLKRPTHFQDARASQQDAVELALKAFGLISGAKSVYLPKETALAGVRLLEDAVIEHDARAIEGWRLSESDVTGRAIFEKPGEQLEVITANKRPLETLLGIDLIYFNQLQKSLVMVQYKMMEPQPRGRHTEVRGKHSFEELDEKEWIVPIDDQFEAELKLMESYDRDLAPAGDYRLNSSAFFLKLVKRYASTSTSSVMLSLGHFNHLRESGVFKGPRDGFWLTYSGLRNQYLRTDAFVELVRSGYIGSRGATTDHLYALIDAAMDGGRGAVAAIQTSIKESGHDIVDDEQDPEKPLILRRRPHGRR
ncbi:hypothetical protein A6U86_27280 [Rhizobium sp. AC27/96]|uniref:hypothetical protein n=1 Tax=Rhizobium sp. AC27/96 TaxID=1841653 RepID=UPI00082869A4|nr:hypothetical protein [Rhizobium sp. AC27/96]OCJ08621.1 hypothetical protein A6U86_27280 [Rhizobium sp. AC27/96]